MKPEQFRNYVLSPENRAAGEYILKLAGPLDGVVVLGSGLAGTLDSYGTWGQPVASVPLSCIPGVSAPVGDGHVDEFRVYQVPRGGTTTTIAVALGRTHLYEGVGPEKVTALVRAAAAAGARTAVLCNANGCLRDWNLGDVMAIEDHVNFSGVSPFTGTVFLDTSACWDPALTDTLASVCERRGTYAILRGPEYQTPLETRLLAAAGVDCVGMSTVMEALTLHALGVRVCGMSVVTDLSFASAPTDPTAVVETGKRAQKRVFEGIQAVFGS